MRTNSSRPGAKPSVATDRGDVRGEWTARVGRRCTQKRGLRPGGWVSCSFISQLKPDEPRRSQTLQTLGQVGEGFVVGLALGCRAAGGGRVEDVVDALDRHQKQALGAPAALLEEHDGIQRNGREHARGELFARERRVGDGRLLRYARPVPMVAPLAAPDRTDLAASVERGVVAVLCDDGAELEEERRVVVAEADEVEQQLGIGGADDLLVVVGPLTADGPGAEAGGAGAREQRE